MLHPKLRKMFTFSVKDKKTIFNPMSLVQISASVLKSESFLSHKFKDSLFRRLMLTCKPLSFLRTTISEAYYNEAYIIKAIKEGRGKKKEKTLLRYVISYVCVSDSEIDSEEGTDWFCDVLSNCTDDEIWEEDSHPVPVEGCSVFRKIGAALGEAKGVELKIERK